MFSGIVEQMVALKAREEDGSNVHFTFETDLVHELKIDQSVAHNGVCLTIVDIGSDEYTVTAIEETLNLTNLGELKLGDKVNFERCLKVSDRIDGHIVQGHVDGTAEVSDITELEGSWEFTFTHDLDDRLILKKGSITINGVSLTIIHNQPGLFKVAIIPYTYEHTNFHTFRLGDKVNIELDVLGKYVANMLDPLRS